MSPERVSVGEEGEDHSMCSGESGARNLEAESIRSRAESTARCVKLKTVTEIRRNSARGAFIVQRERQRERECVCERERERERQRDRERERE